MKSLGEVLQLSADFLKEKGIARPRRQAEELLSDVVKMARIELYMHYDRLMQEEELDRYRQAVRRKAAGEPWQYIAGEVSFLGCRISLDRNVLIPRQETEILASRVLEAVGDAPLDVWDICCGSGCIGLGLKKGRPSWRVALSDISEKALSVARENGRQNGIEVSFFCGDLLKPFEGRKADIVICNPPYLAEREFAGLDREVRDFEPKGALVGGRTGYEFYERLAVELPLFMNPSGKVFLEIGTGMGEGVKKLFYSTIWKNHLVSSDWSGHDRFFSVEFE